MSGSCTCNGPPLAQTLAKILDFQGLASDLRQPDTVNWIMTMHENIEKGSVITKIILDLLLLQF